MLKGEIFCEVATLVVTPENILNNQLPWKKIAADT